MVSIQRTYQNEVFGKMSVVAHQGKMYFPAADCAKMLGCSNPYRVIHDRCRHAIDCKVEVQCGIHPDGTPVTQIVRKKYIPMDDLSYLISRSHVPHVDEFKRWVIEEILCLDMSGNERVESAVDVGENTSSVDEGAVLETNLQVFSNPLFGKVRTLVREDEPWFVGKDVCNVFGDSNHNRSLSRLSDDNRVVFTVATVGGRQKIVFVNEPGLYELLLSMRPQKAHHTGVQNEYPPEIEARIEKLALFRRWVTHDVLPSIRKHGAYMTPEKLLEMASDPREYAKLLNTLADEQDARLALEATTAKQAEQIEEMRPKVDFCDTVLSTPQTTSITLIAKDYGMSGCEMNKLLHSLGVQYQASGTWVLYQNHAVEGYTKTRTYTIHTKEGNPKTVVVKVVFQ